MSVARDDLQEHLLKLKSDNEFLSGQIPFLAQRLVDYKKSLKNNIDAIAEIGETLKLLK